MTTYHISSSGKAVICHASKKACPRKNFASFEEASFAAAVQAHPSFGKKSEAVDFQPFSSVRRGWNAEGQSSPIYSQLDEESKIRDNWDRESDIAVGRYQMTVHEAINIILRDDNQEQAGYMKARLLDQEGLDRFRPQIQKDIEHLDKTFDLHARKGGEDRILYRAVPARWGSTQESLLEKYKVGSVIEEKAYLSTSVDPDNILLHSATKEKQTIVFEIKSRNGLTLHKPDAGGGSILKYEREVLLRRGSRFKVVAVGEATYASSHSNGYPGGRPTWRKVKRKHRFTVIQLEEIS